MSELINAFGLDLELLVVQIVNFGVVLLVLWYFLYRPLLNVIEKRERKMSQGVKDAEKAKKKLDDAEEQEKQVLARANKEAEEVIAEGRQYAEKEKETILREARQSGQKELEHARQRAQEQKDEFLKESREEVAKMAVLSAERILREKRGGGSEKTAG